MLIGVYVKNFKCYQGRHFVPCFSLDQNGKFVSYLGNNGVGKSAILEALDAFFSKKPHWYRNKDSKKGSSECFVAPVFLVENKKYSKDVLDISDKLSKNIKIEVSDNYTLVCIAKREDGVFVFFDGKKEVTAEDQQKEARKIYELLMKAYQYVYIDAEVDIDEQARISSEIYELIIGSSVVTEVEKQFKEADSKQKLIDGLNKALEELIDNELTKGLKQIDKDYSYGGTKGAISKLTANVLAKVSTEAFLYARKLKYKGKQIDSLSSGQRRRALLDFIIAIIKKKIIGSSKTFILAIDEPEISLDASIKMSQFEKLLEIANANVCVMITSHWYGWIPSTNVGRSILIDDKDSGEKDIQIFENKDFPFRDSPKYEMRMIFDFLTSLGASAEANKTTKYIICEGPSDVIYLQASLNDTSYKIIPVGKERVIKIAGIFKNYFWKENGPTLKNIIFMVDTDPEQGDSCGDNCYLKRWSKDSDLKVTLVSGNENIHKKCTIEDVLEPVVFLDSLKVIHHDKVLIPTLSVKYPNSFGPDAFGLDSILDRTFYKESKERKIDLAKEYQKKLKDLTHTNNLKSLIDGAF